MSGLASLQGAAGLPIPAAQIFHALGAVKARYQGAEDTSPPGRVDAERRIGLSCEQVIATPPPGAELTSWVSPPRRSWCPAAWNRRLLAVRRRGAAEFSRPAADAGPAGGTQGHRHSHRRAAQPPGVELAVAAARDGTGSGVSSVPPALGHRAGPRGI